MLLIHCPYCREDRLEIEFRAAGEAHVVRSPALASQGEEEFEAFLFRRSNTKGHLHERWRHLHGCGRFFNAVRDTVSDRFLMTYKAGEPKPTIAPGQGQ
jgi:sarcosine oxidase subunit delta